MRFVVSILALAALVACDPVVPDSGAGVGFDNYVQYESASARREAELAGTAVPGVAISNETPRTEGQEIAGETLAALGAGQPSAPVAPVKIDANNPNISDENDFSAVSSRETIEDNAAKIAAQRDAYKQIEPGALPQRGNLKDGATLVEFALSTTNRVGQSIYSRSLIAAQTRFQRNCAKYGSPDMAQEDFLKRGGPQRDPQGLDPDGDGFACSWDPTPFRLAARG